MVQTLFYVSLKRFRIKKICGSARLAWRDAPSLILPILLLSALQCLMGAMKPYLFAYIFTNLSQAALTKIIAVFFLRRQDKPVGEIMDRSQKITCCKCSGSMTPQDRFYYQTHCFRCEDDMQRVAHESSTAVKSPAWVYRLTAYYVRRFSNQKLIPLIEYLREFRSS